MGRSSGLVVGGVGILVLLVARAALAVRVDRLTSLPDEVGFLGNAWLLGQGEPAPPMGFAPFYPAGQAVVLAPVALVVRGADALATAARLVDVVLLAAMVPVLVALLSRLGRLDPGRRALAAVTAAALPGLWVAAVVVWPDALAALLWPVTLLALFGLAGRGRVAGRIWFGPAVVGLWLVHPRFLPVLVLAAVLVLVRLLAPHDEPAAGEDGVSSGPLGPRTADVANLVLGAVVLAVGLWLNDEVAVRWDRIAPGPLSGATDDLGATTEGSLRSLVGQTWYALAATITLAGVGAGTLGRLAWRAGARGRALWTEPVPVVALAAVAGWLAVVAGAAVQLRSPFGFGTEPLLDLVANGRYQEVVLAPLVAVGAARLLRPVADRSVERVTAIVLLVLAVLVTLVLGSGPDVLDPSTAAGTTWARSTWTSYPVVLPTVLALAVLAAARLGRPSARRGLVVVVAVALGFGAVGVERASEVVDRSRTTSPVSRDLPRLRDRLDGAPVAYLSDPDTLPPLAEVSWGLAEEGMTVTSPGEAPPEDLVVTSEDFVTEVGAEGLAPGARLTTILDDSGLALWALPGPEAERLASAGLLYPESRARGLPDEARRARLEALTAEARITVAGTPAVVRVTNEGSQVWPGAGRPGERPVDLVLTDSEGTSLRVPVGELDPGATTDVALPVAEVAETFGLGAHEVLVTIGPEDEADFASPPVGLTLDVP